MTTGVQPARETPLPDPIDPERPLTALAPMQDVTTLGFLRLLGDYGPPDYLFTEYFRVTAHSKPEPHIIDSVLHHGTGRPVFAQMIGESVPDLLRTAGLLGELPIAGVDLNMGCPAPKVYKKNVGGGLLRDPQTVERLLSALRGGIKGRFTVKMRIGFDTIDNYDRLLKSVADNGVNLLSVHGRTVKGGYRSEVDYPRIAQAVSTVPCPVLANGNISSAAKAQAVIAETGAAGVMIGRACIRNPWIFRQIHEQWTAQPIFQPRLSDVRTYLDALYYTITDSSQHERYRLARLKKFLNFIGVAVDPDGNFLHRARRVKTWSELQQLADEFMIDYGKADLPYPDEPWPGLIARPNCEGEEYQACSLS
jgi:tRNA-dihydrouridine synthase B